MNKFFYPKRRFICITGSFLILILSVSAFFTVLRSRAINTHETLFSYNITANADYNVVLIPNELYPDGVLSEGLIYSDLLTDHIELKLLSEFSGSLASDITGTYSVTAVVEGYQESNDNSIIVYEKHFPLINDEKTLKGQAALGYNIPVSFELNTYREYVKDASALLGFAVSNRFYILFEGSYNAVTSHGNVADNFSYSISIPLNLSAGSYQISKDQPFSNSGEIASDSESIYHAPLWQKLIAVVFIVLSSVFSAYLLLFTEGADDDEIYIYKVKNILRKYGSHMVCLALLPSFSDTIIIPVVNIDNLIMFAQELHRPVFYAADNNGLPIDGIFYVPDMNITYTTKVVVNTTP